jgi:hypothetical protein
MVFFKVLASLVLSTTSPCQLRLNGLFPVRINTASHLTTRLSLKMTMLSAGTLPPDVKRIISPVMISIDVLNWEWWWMTEEIQTKNCFCNGS